MSIRLIAAAAAFAFTAVAGTTIASTTADAGFKKRADRAAPARASSCPITNMIKASRERLAKRVHHVRAHHVRSERPARTVRVARRAPTK